MWRLIISILAFLNFSMQAQEQFRTFHFHWSPKTKTIQKEIFSIDPETHKKDWVKTETYVFYNTYLDTMIVDLGNAKEVTEYNYTIDGNIKGKRTNYLLSETEDKSLFFYDKSLHLIKSQEFVQGKLFSETKYLYNKQNHLIKSVCKEKETGFSEITEYSNYLSEDSYTKTSYYKDKEKDANISVEMFQNGLLMEGSYQIFDLKSKVVYRYDDNNNVIFEQKDNDAPTYYQYEYDVAGNPTKISISNSQNPYLNSEIILKSKYSEFKTN